MATYKSLQKSGTNSNNLTKASSLVSKLKSDITRISKEVLGPAKTPLRFNPQLPMESYTHRFNTLQKTIGAALNLSADPRNPTLNGTLIQHERIWWQHHKVEFPQSKTESEWISWWKDRHTFLSNLITESRDTNHLLTDDLARTDPKRFYKQIIKPFMSTHISSIRHENKTHTTDPAIEHVLTDFLTGMGRASDETIPQIPPNYSPNPHLSLLLKPITQEELSHGLSSSNTTSSAGHDGITPRLLKYILTVKWPTGADNLTTDRPHMNTESSTSKTSLTSHTSPPTSPDHSYPKHAPAIILDILNYSLPAKDIPDSEKLSIVRGIPKTEGQARDTTLLRPISVSPAIYRLLHNILAHRLSSALLTQNTIDKAQFAFLPGKDIHEDINSVLTCYKDRKANNEACYAIFYDISKAYDTIRWSSIQHSLIRLKFPPEFIDFIRNSLTGSHLAMRTNIPNRITPKVPIFNSIKQGCPLGPLLFVLIIDELHCNYRNTGGYALTPTTTVSSRGYCDDTAILAKDLDTLSAYYEQSDIRILPQT
jgi:hypothetical protein